MKKILCFVFFLLILSVSAYAQTLYSFDNTVKIDVPNSWYRSRMAPTPGVEQVLVVNGDKDTCVAITRDVAFVMMYDMASMPENMKAKFIDNQIQIFMKKYPNGYVHSVDNMQGLFGDDGISIRFRVPYQGSTAAITAMYFAKYYNGGLRLHTLLMTTPFVGTNWEDIASVLRSIQFQY